MRRCLPSLLSALLPVLIFAQPAGARQVKPIQPLSLPAGQPVRITGMDLEFGGQMMIELAESDAKAARKRAEAGLPALDSASYPVGPLDGARYATMPFKQMFPLVIRDVTREWRLDEGKPVFLRIMIDRLHTASAAVAILVGGSPDVLGGNVDVIDPTTGGSLGSFRVEVVNSHSGWGGMLIRGGGIREKLAEEFGLELSRHISGRKKRG
ncbi:MAG: hypothetical protein ABW164_07770 [Sphingobium sp.]